MEICIHKFDYVLCESNEMFNFLFLFFEICAGGYEGEGEGKKCKREVNFHNFRLKNGKINFSNYEIYAIQISKGEILFEHNPY